MIVADGVEIRGLKASAIARPAGEPVLEFYRFITHRDCANISLDEAVRLTAHIALENYQEIKVTALAFLDDGEIYWVDDLISPLISNTPGDIPLI